MTDLINEIAAEFAGYDPEYDEPNEAAQATIDLIIARIPPLVWEAEGRTVFSTKGYVVIKDDISGLYKSKPDGDKLSAGYSSEKSAKAAAQAHHVAQLCKGMGIE